MSGEDPIATAQAQARRSERHRRRGPARPPSERPAYAGLVTRAVAFAIDGAIINLASILLSAVVALAMSVIFDPVALQEALIVLGGATYLVWVTGYFVVSWSTGGQTIGNRVMQIRVVDASDGQPIGVRRAWLRFLGLTLAAIPLLAGFLILLWDDRRRALQDRLARTVVVDAPPE